jgi:hypothetical protein
VDRVLKEIEAVAAAREEADHPPHIIVQPGYKAELPVSGLFFSIIPLLLWHINFPP